MVNIRACRDWHIGKKYRIMAGGNLTKLSMLSYVPSINNQCTVIIIRKAITICYKGDNFRLIVARAIKQKLEALAWNFLTHMLYSPDIVESEYHSFLIR